MWFKHQQITWPRCATPQNFIWNTGRNIAYPLFLIYRKSLQCGKVPAGWKLAEVTAIHNKKASIRWQDSSPTISGYWPTVSRTQASDAMTYRLPRYEAKCVQRRCFQCGSVPLRSDIKGTELLFANILIPLQRQLIALQRCRWQFLYNVDFCNG